MFWSELAKYKNQIAVIDGDDQYTYTQLADACQQKSLELHSLAKDRKQLFFIKTRNTYASLLNYLGCLQAKHAAMLIDPDSSDEQIAKLQQQYQPAALLDEGEVKILEAGQTEISQDLALLLSTSGTTGSAKQVALSFGNLNSNAQSICDYLPIQGSDRALCTLPMFYSYGLSVINSHLLSGSTLVFSQYSAVNREFWQVLDTHRITSLAGVPHSYDILMRLRLTANALPHLRYLTQAGGKLEAAKVVRLAEYAEQYSKQFFVMYGQTEATARMAYLSAEKVLAKPESIGQAIPQGKLILKNASGDMIHEPHQVGELHYTGPNVMLGYAKNRQDLSLFNTSDWLATGDLAYFDEEGDFYIAGRIKRIVKITGQRINLDEVESWLKEQGMTGYCCGNDKTLVLGVTGEVESGAVRTELAKFMRLHPTSIKVVHYDTLPLNANGKKDYAQVMIDAGLETGALNG